MMMDQHRLMDALVLSKRIGNLLHETMDLSQQLAQALDRNDSVTVRMIMNMREEPIGKLKTADQALRELQDSISDPEERKHLTALLRGEDSPQEKEHILASQSRSNARQLKQVLELDRRLNQKIAREKSVYHK
jgi:GTP cyclohydrolase III